MSSNTSSLPSHIMNNDESSYHNNKNDEASSSLSHNNVKNDDEKRSSLTQNKQSDNQNQFTLDHNIAFDFVLPKEHCFSQILSQFSDISDNMIMQTNENGLVLLFQNPWQTLSIYVGIPIVPTFLYFFNNATTHGSVNLLQFEELLSSIRKTACIRIHQEIDSTIIKIEYYFPKPCSKSEKLFIESNVISKEVANSIPSKVIQPSGHKFPYWLLVQSDVFVKAIRELPICNQNTIFIGIHGLNISFWSGPEVIGLGEIVYTGSLRKNCPMSDQQRDTPLSISISTESLRSLDKLLQNKHVVCKVALNDNLLCIFFKAFDDKPICIHLERQSSHNILFPNFYPSQTAANI